MTRITKNEAKKALDTLIEKSRVHLYKPIQIAEILYQHRQNNITDLLNIEEYRTQSKKWRDTISIELLGRKCTSSAKFQDNLFEKNAIPPEILHVLGKENIKNKGAVEAYIYQQFTHRHTQLAHALDYSLHATPKDFSIQQFIDSFWAEPGLKRSIDKIYEIVVYALFFTLVESLNLKINVFIPEKSLPILREFENFSLDTELAKNIVTSVTSDQIIIVCKDVEKSIIISLLTQIGWKNRIQSIITEKELVQWYEKALRGKYARTLATKLLSTLSEEIKQEFPYVESIPSILKQRHYEKIKDNFWE